VLAQALLSLRPDLRSSAPNTPEDARLAEMDFGTWEGQRWAEIHHAELQAWTDNFAHYRAGGGESVQEFMDRVGEALRQACIGTAEDGDMVWVSHAGVARAVSLLSQGITHLDAAHQWPQAGPDFGEFVIFDISAETQSALRV
jgi:alpha-ribazole phosphatase